MLPRKRGGCSISRPSITVIECQSTCIPAGSRLLSHSEVLSVCGPCLSCARVLARVRRFCFSRNEIDSSAQRNYFTGVGEQSQRPGSRKEHRFRPFSDSI